MEKQKGSEVPSSDLLSNVAGLNVLVSWLQMRRAKTSVVIAWCPCHCCSYRSGNSNGQSILELAIWQELQRQVVPERSGAGRPEGTLLTAQSCFHAVLCSLTCRLSCHHVKVVQDAAEESVSVVEHCVLSGAKNKREGVLSDMNFLLIFIISQRKLSWFGIIIRLNILIIHKTTPTTSTTATTATATTTNTTATTTTTHYYYYLLNPKP